MTMWKAPAAIALSWTIYLAGASAGEIAFSAKPQVQKAGDKVTINFTVAAPTDVEVAVLNAKGEVVRHLAAGVLGAKNAPPEPLQAALAQELVWDGQDDFGKAAAGGPFKVRVRAGMDVKFGRLIGADPYNFGAIDSMATDEDGNIFIMGCQEEQNQMNMTLRVFDPNGRYLREIMPFPANLPPDAMKDVARWDAERKTFSPRNLRSLNPDFYGQPGGYWGNPSLQIISANTKTGLLLTDGGSKLFRLSCDGTVPGSTFAQGGLWGKKALSNTGHGPSFFAFSPDGKYLYLSGPFSATDAYGHVAEADSPPGQVYRMEFGKGTMEPFAKLPTIGKFENQGWTSAHIVAPTHYGSPHGPIHGIAVDKDGNVLIADQDNQRVAVFSSDGKELGKIDAPFPHLLAIHPRTGEVYVLTLEIKGYGQFKKSLLKYSSWKEGKQLAAFDLGTDRFTEPSIALSAGPQTTMVWISGVQNGPLAVADKGATMEPTKTQFAANSNLPRDWERIAVDPQRDEVYVSNGCNLMWRFDGRTGEGGPLKKDGKDYHVLDLAVGYDGLLYVQASSDTYSGPCVRLTRDLEPAPYEGSGSNVIANYVYGRAGNGFCVRGLGAGAQGQVYEPMMYKWAVYAIAGFGPDGKPMNGKYLKGQIWDADKKGLTKSPGLDSAVFGPVPQATGNIRVDLAGDVYVAMLYRPKDAPVAKGFEKDQGYRVTVGTVVRFSPEGGGMKDAEGAPIATSLDGVKQVYCGLAPFSSATEGFGGNSCCVCRTPRFDLDSYGRLLMPNCMTNSVTILDNAGNKVLEFGKYGNFDSLYMNPNTDAGKQKKPTVAVPEIPMAWPTCAGFSENSIYVLDTYARRVIRLDKTFAVEATCQMK